MCFDLGYDANNSRVDFTSDQKAWLLYGLNYWSKIDQSEGGDLNFVEYSHDPNVPCPTNGEFNVHVYPASLPGDEIGSGNPGDNSVLEELWGLSMSRGWRRVTLSVLPLSLALLGAVGVHRSIVEARQEMPAPTVQPYQSEGSTAFLVDCKNVSDRPIRVYASGITKTRVDGAEIGGPNSGSSGARHDIPPGQTWKEFVHLVAAGQPGGRRPVNPDPKSIVGSRDVAVQLAPGPHNVAFSCGGAWSAERSFDWQVTPRGSTPKAVSTAAD